MREFRIIHFCFIMLCYCSTLFAQNDSNYVSLNSTLPDSVKYQKFEKGIRAITQRDPPYGMKYARYALSTFTKLNYKPGIAQGNLSIAGAFYYVGEPDSMNAYATKAVDLFTALHNNIKICGAYKNIGLSFEMKADYEKAAKYYFLSLQYAQKCNDALSLANSYSSVTNVLLEQKKYVAALKYNNLALGIFKTLDFPAGNAGAYGNRGLIYFYFGKSGLGDQYYDSSLVMQDSCFEIANRNGIESQKMNAYINKGVVYSQTKQHEKAVEVNLIVLDQATKANNIYAVTLSSLNIGIGNNALHKYPLASTYLKTALTNAEKYGFKDLRKEAYYAISETEHNLSNEKDARTHLLSYIALNDSILNEQTQKSMNELQILYESEKKDKELLKNQVDIKNGEIETEHRLFQRNIFIGGFILMLGFAFFIFRGYRAKTKANTLIAEQKYEVEQQKNIVEEKQKEILDSIHYAQKIQQSLLPTEVYIEKNLNRLKKS